MKPHRIISGIVTGRGPWSKEIQQLLDTDQLRRIGSSYPLGPIYFLPSVHPEERTTNGSFSFRLLQTIDPNIMIETFNQYGIPIQQLLNESIQDGSGIWLVTEDSDPIVIIGGKRFHT